MNGSADKGDNPKLLCFALGKMIMKQKRESQTPLACIKQLVFHSQLVSLHLEQALPKAQVSAALHAFCIARVIVAPPGVNTGVLNSTTRDLLGRIILCGRWSWALYLFF